MERGCDRWHLLAQVTPIPHTMPVHLPPCTVPLHLPPQLKRHQEEADGYKAAAAEYAKGLDTLSRGSQSDLQRDLGDTVRRMAVVQVRDCKQTLFALIKVLHPLLVETQ